MGIDMNIQHMYISEWPKDNRNFIQTIYMKIYVGTLGIKKWIHKTSKEKYTKN